MPLMLLRGYERFRLRFQMPRFAILYNTPTPDIVVTLMFSPYFFFAATPPRRLLTLRVATPLFRCLAQR